MTHFSSEKWFDFARESVPAEEKVLMQSHLNEGCDSCLKASEVWRTALAALQRERDYSPPPDAVHIVKSAYLSEGPSRWLPKIARIARLIFDSALQPSAAPVRSVQASSRQFLHEAEPFIVDLRIESDPARRRVWLMGQVLDSKRPEAEMNGVDVVLLSGEQFVAKTVAKSSGEFEFEFGEERRLQLFINIRGHRAIGIILPDSDTQHNLL